MRFVPFLLLCAACGRGVISEPPMIMDDEMRPDTGGSCWESGVDGLGRLNEVDVEVVFTPSSPSDFHFDSARIVSGGTAVSESVAPSEVTWRVTPQDAATPVVFELGVGCEGSWVDTYTPTTWTFSVLSGDLGATWSVLASDSAR